MKLFHTVPEFNNPLSNPNLVHEQLLDNEMLVSIKHGLSNVVMNK